MNSGTMKPARGAAEPQGGAARVRDLAAGRGDQRVARRDIPFARSARGGDRCRPGLPPPGRI